jgi:hypothetical protein
MKRKNPESSGYGTATPGAPPKAMTLDEIRAAAFERYRGRLQMETDEQAVKIIVAEVAATRLPKQRTREAIEAWVEEHLEELAEPMILFTDAQVQQVRESYQQALVKHAMRHAEFIAAQHAQDIANAAIPPFLPETLQGE